MVSHYGILLALEPSIGPNHLIIQVLIGNTNNFKF